MLKPAAGELSELLVPWLQALDCLPMVCDCPGCEECFKHYAPGWLKCGENTKSKRTVDSLCKCCARRHDDLVEAGGQWPEVAPLRVQNLRNYEAAKAKAAACKARGCAQI